MFQFKVFIRKLGTINYEELAWLSGSDQGISEPEQGISEPEQGISQPEQGISEQGNVTHT
jgi:hypothetical protein